MDWKKSLIKKQLDRGPLETRRFSCPCCKSFECLIELYNPDTIEITCDCGEHFVWSSEQKKLYGRYPDEKENYTEYPESFFEKT